MLIAVALLVAAAPPVEALARKCSGGDGPACAELSRLYRAGDGVPRDLSRAVQAAEDGCEAGAAALCVDAGRARLRGEGVKRDPKRAAQLFGDACTQRSQAGCLDLALMNQNGAGIPQDTGRALALLEQACAGEDASACQLAGDLLYARHDQAGAAARYARACSSSAPSGCTKQADLLRLAARDPAAADALYRKACAAGEKDACTVLALPRGCKGRDACLAFADLCSDYLAGYDVLPEPRLARAPCELACDGGVGDACDSLADMFDEGAGVPVDRAHAETLRKRACSLGDRDACVAAE